MLAEDGSAYEAPPKVSSKVEMMKILRAGRAGKPSNPKPVLEDIDKYVRSSSRYRSCLLPKAAKPSPVQTAKDSVTESLCTDEMRFNLKYSLGIHAPHRSGAKPQATYNIVMPSSPVHCKFSTTEVARPEKTNSKKRPKFSVQTLRRWFLSMDADGSGSIGRREMLLAMRNQQELKDIFSEAVSQNGSKPSSLPGTTQLQTNGDADKMLRAELQHIMEILAEVDSDGSGTLEWEEVLEFFRRSGYLLEYSTKPELNEMDFGDSDDSVEGDWDASEGGA